MDKEDHVHNFAGGQFPPQLIPFLRTRNNNNNNNNNQSDNPSIQSDNSSIQFPEMTPHHYNGMNQNQIRKDFVEEQLKKKEFYMKELVECHLKKARILKEILLQQCEDKAKQVIGCEEEGDLVEGGYSPRHYVKKVLSKTMSLSDDTGTTYDGSLFSVSGLED